MKKISRYGSYGIVTEKGALLLTPKNSGPYRGLWDLPGGGIEFGESPESAMHRELGEEAALKAESLQLLEVLSHNTDYPSKEGAAQFHHVGVLYRVYGHVTVEEMEPEASIRWANISELSADELTPFARAALTWLNGESLC